MKKLIVISLAAIIVTSCKLPAGAKYYVQGKDTEGSETTFVAADTTMNNGCISFTDLCGRGNVTLCGTFGIVVIEK